MRTIENSKALLGKHHGHRFGAGDPIPEIWLTTTPKQARQIELLFAAFKEGDRARKNYKGNILLLII